MDNDCIWKYVYQEVTYECPWMTYCCNDNECCPRPIDTQILFWVGMVTLCLLLLAYLIWWRRRSLSEEKKEIPCYFSPVGGARRFSGAISPRPVQTIHTSRSQFIPLVQINHFTAIHTNGPIKKSKDHKDVFASLSHRLKSFLYVTKSAVSHTGERRFGNRVASPHPPGPTSTSSARKIPVNEIATCPDAPQQDVADA